MVTLRSRVCIPVTDAKQMPVSAKTPIWQNMKWIGRDRHAYPVDVLPNWCFGRGALKCEVCNTMERCINNECMRASRTSLLKYWWWLCSVHETGLWSVQVCYLRSLGGQPRQQLRLSLPHASCLWMPSIQTNFLQIKQANAILMIRNSVKDKDLYQVG